VRGGGRGASVPRCAVRPGGGWGTMAPPATWDGACPHPIRRKLRYPYPRFVPLCRGKARPRERPSLTRTVWDEPPRQLADKRSCHETVERSQSSDKSKSHVESKSNAKASYMFLMLFSQIPPLPNLINADFPDNNTSSVSKNTLDALLLTTLLSR